MTLELRYMVYQDIAQVAAIENLSFSSPWPINSFAFEIGESTYAHMVVLTESISRPVGALDRWRHRFGLTNGKSRANGQAAGAPILAYGGLWSILDEAHISTIASNPEWRGRGYGELALAAMIRRALTLNAAYIVLEVRVSNVVAQNLYKKYGFTVADVKTGYYRDNGEDAYDMRLDLSDSAANRAFEERYQMLLARHQAEDHYSDAARPRLGRWSGAI